MRKLVNIAIVITVFLAGWYLAGSWLDGQYAKIAPDIAKWMWGLGALLIGVLAQLSWKVHESKRVEGLTVEQRMRVRRVSGLIGLRIYFLGLCIFTSSCLGFASAYVKNAVVSQNMTQISLGAMLASAVICVFLVPMMQRDIQRFEDLAREEMSLQKAADALSDKLKD